MNRKKLLVITTTNDISIPLLFSTRIKNKFDIEILLIEDIIDHTFESLKYDFYDFVYIRDLFNSGLTPNQISSINKLVETFKTERFVDSVKSSADLLFEDKWTQYKIYQEFMPKTYLLESYNDEIKGDYIIKKRISSRSKDIFFSLEDITSNFEEYIIQSKSTIRKEYRVNVVNGNIIDKILVKGVNEKGQLKVIGSDIISHELKLFVKKILTYSKTSSFELIGIDIIETNESNYQLLEINRSPQINAFYKYTEINLFEEMLLKI